MRHALFVVFSVIACASAALGACGDGDGIDFTAGPPFACGSDGLVCEGGEACWRSGPGVCVGSPPGPGGCGPDCMLLQCGPGPVCICAWFECVDVGACTSCACALATPGHGMCRCEEREDGLFLDCPGA